MARGKVPARQPNNALKSVGYMCHGRAADRQGRSLAEIMGERVAFIETNNIEAESPDAIAAHLHASASQGSGRLRSPYLHFIVSFDADDARAGKVPEDVQHEIAAKVIERMGLAEYQGAIFGHKDTQNPHMHFLFSRVHPETLKAWDNSKSGARLTEIVRGVALEHGLNVSRSQEQGAAQINEAEYHDARRQGRAPFQSFTPEQRAEIRGQTLGAFREATGWADLSQRLEAQGLRLGMAGKGHKAALYVYGETNKAKLSDIFGKEKDIRTAKLAERFGQSFTAYAKENGIKAPERPQTGTERAEATEQAQGGEKGKGFATVKPLDPEEQRLKAELAAAMSERDAHIQQAQKAQSAEQAATQAQQNMAALAAKLAAHEQEAARSRAEIMEAIAEAYTDPAAARKAWERYEAERINAGRQAARAFEPERFGRIRGNMRAWVKDAQRRKALAAIERMKKARARFVAERERAEVARVRIPAAEQKAKEKRDAFRAIEAVTGDREQRNARLEQLNERVRQLSHELAKKQLETNNTLLPEQGRDDEGRGWDWDE